METKELSHNRDVLNVVQVTTRKSLELLMIIESLSHMSTLKNTKWQLDQLSSLEKRSPSGML